MHNSFILVKFFEDLLLSSGDMRHQSLVAHHELDGGVVVRPRVDSQPLLSTLGVTSPRSAKKGGTFLS